MKNGQKKLELSSQLVNLAMSLGELQNKLLSSEIADNVKYSIQLQIEQIKAQQHSISVQLINLIDEDFQTTPSNKYTP